MGVSISTMRSAVRCREFTALDCRCQASRAGRQVRWTGPRRRNPPRSTPVVCPGRFACPSAPPTDEPSSAGRRLRQLVAAPRTATISTDSAVSRRSRRRLPRLVRSGVRRRRHLPHAVGVLLRRLAAAGRRIRRPARSGSGGAAGPAEAAAAARSRAGGGGGVHRHDASGHPVVRHRAAGDGVVDVPAELAPRRQCERLSRRRPVGQPAAASVVDIRPGAVLSGCARPRVRARVAAPRTWPHGSRTARDAARCSRDRLADLRDDQRPASDVAVLRHPAARMWELLVGGLLACAAPYLRVPRVWRVLLAVAGSRSSSRAAWCSTDEASSRDRGRSFPSVPHSRSSSPGRGETTSIPPHPTARVTSPGSAGVDRVRAVPVALAGPHRVPGLARRSRLSVSPAASSSSASPLCSPNSPPA